ncbi:MAG: GntR family transcriptional regulator [Pseudomonadota bacterium]
MPIPTDFQKVARIGAKDRALSQIQRWIIEGTLAAGEKLVDAELAEALGVSRTPIREAFLALEMQGFVEVRPGRETRVAGIEKNDILRIYLPLAALQSLAAEIAAPIISRERIEKLKGVNAEFTALIDQGRPFQAMELDEDFHNLIIEAADNPYISSFAATMQMHIRRFKFLFLKNIKPTDRSSSTEHARLIAALEAGDAQEAAGIMKSNILRPMRELFESLAVEEND